MGFFRNDEKTACDTKISNSLATVQPNDIIVIIFRLDVLVNVSLFRPLFPLAQSKRRKPPTVINSKWEASGGEKTQNTHWQ